jgi:hypothetical protein
MTVVISVEGSATEAYVYTKGAAERLRALCTPDSVPADLD